MGNAYNVKALCSLGLPRAWRRVAKWAGKLFFSKRRSHFAESETPTLRKVYLFELEDNSKELMKQVKEQGIEDVKGFFARNYKFRLLNGRASFPNLEKFHKN